MLKHVFGAALLAAALAAQAHTAQIEPDGPNRFAVQFWGHGGRTEPYATSKVRSVTAFDARGGAVSVSTAVGADGVVRATTAAPAAVVLLTFDNGIWSRAEGGKSEEKPMNENPGATRGTHALKVAKTVAQWNAAVTRVYGQPLEIVPLAAAAPRVGQPLRVRVLYAGKPLAGAKVAADEDAPAVLTDADGVAALPVVAGRNTVWVNHRIDVAREPRFTQLSLEAVLRFEGQ
jgi:nickel transport protein